MAKTRIKIRRGYLGKGAEVHHFGYDYRRKLWIPLCSPNGVKESDMVGSQRPLTCFKCLKRLGIIDQFPGPDARRTALEIDHLVRTSQRGQVPT